jgi:hypothetical protein
MQCLFRVALEPGCNTPSAPSATAAKPAPGQLKTHNSQSACITPLIAAKHAAVLQTSASTSAFVAKGVNVALMVAYKQKFSCLW